MSTDQSAYQRDYYAANRERLLADAKAKYKDDPEFRAASNRRGKKYRKNLKDQVIAGYGGLCTCCGESNPAFLSVDHVNGGGRKHRASLGGGVSLYLDIIKREFPDDMTLLCYNCNLWPGVQRRCVSPQTLTSSGTRNAAGCQPAAGFRRGERQCSYSWGAAAVKGRGARASCTRHHASLTPSPWCSRPVASLFTPGRPERYTHSGARR